MKIKQLKQECEELKGKNDAQSEEISKWVESALFCFIIKIYEDF